jgi:hypothetical protein
MADKADLLIPKELKKKLEKKAKETGFKSVGEYIIFILEQVVSDSTEDFGKQVYTEKEEKDIRGPNIFSADEEEALKKNLEDLGYI